jgi:hypothetical protein
MAAAIRKVKLKCTGITLLPSGGQLVTMSKPAEATTTQVGTAKVVNPDEAKLELVTDGAEGYVVGNEYTVTVTGG